MLRHTLETAAATGALVAVVTADPGVARWTKAQGHEVIPESPEHGTGLDGAATAAVAAAERRQTSWVVVHADLPLLSTSDLEEAISRLEDHDLVLAPSRNGGTSLAGGRAAFPFSYGPGSFHRHLARAVRAGTGVAVVVRTGLAVDLDDPEDLAGLRALAGGDWLEQYL